MTAVAAPPVVSPVRPAQPPHPSPDQALPSWDEARSAHGAGALSDAELACAYVIEGVRREAGPRWLQGEAVGPVSAAVLASPLAAFVARRRLRKIGAPVVSALVGWAEGTLRADVLFRVPTPRELLGYQARGRRCVSLLPEGVPTAPHAGGLAFAVHDLCHLAKFVDAEHHEGQVGFFACVRDAWDGPAWATFEATLDDVWQKERDAVVADMNGSPIFLFAALKMKLKMAVRRRLARDEGRPAPCSGPLSPGEQAAFDDALGQMLTILGLEGPPRDAALLVSTRRDSPESAALLHAFFEDRGRAIVRG